MTPTQRAPTTSAHPFAPNPSLQDQCGHCRTSGEFTVITALQTMHNPPEVCGPV